MATTWLGATTGQLPAAQQIQQFLVTHPATILYTGLSFSSATTAGSGSTATNGLYLAQEILTGTNTLVGRIIITLSVTGNPGPLTVVLHGNNSGVPDNTFYATTVIPQAYITGSATSINIPLPATVTAASHYWITLQAVGDASDFYSWFKSNQTSGAATSTNGTSWTTQTYGFLYNSFDQTPIAPVVHTYEDTGARWTYFGTSGGQLTTFAESTVAQGTNQYVFSERTIAYSSGTPASIS